MKTQLVLLFALVAGTQSTGIPPEVQHLLKVVQRIKHPTYSASFYDNVVAPAQRRLGGHDKGGEGGGMDGEAMAECMQKCEGLMDVMGVLMKEGAALQEAQGDQSKMAAAMKKLCDAMTADHLKALACAGKECGGGMAMIAALGCMCSCPDMMGMMAMESDPVAGMKELCPKRTSLMKCLNNEDTCAPIVEGPEFEMGLKMINAGCTMQEKGCGVDPKAANSMETCGKDFPPACNEAAMSGGDISADCCTAVKTMKDCMGADCFNLAMGAQAEMDTSGAAEKSIKAYEAACPDAGVSLSEMKSAGKAAMETPTESQADAACHAATPALALTTLLAAKTLA
jgi:hypothetical protein